MHFLPQDLALNKSINEQEMIKNSWESDFEKNEKDFATSLALGIFNQSIDCNRSINEQNKFVFNTSLEITVMQHAKKIMDLTKNYDKPPFNEWLSKFSEKLKNSDNKKNFNGIDQNYFNDSMINISGLTKTKLNELFLEHTSKAENKDLFYKVEWHPKRAQQFVNTSDARINSISIELWFDDKKIKEKSLIAIKKSNLKEEDLLSFGKLNKIMLVGIAILVGLIYIRCEFYEKTLSLQPHTL